MRQAPTRPRARQGILGTGLVTSEGELWAKQRKMVSNVFRVEILDDIVAITQRATQRLARPSLRPAPPCR